MSSQADSEYKCTLSAESLKKAQVELNEDPETRLLEVKTLRQRLEKVPGLKVRKDTKFLLRFLRARKFDQEAAFKMVKRYYEVRRDSPDFYDDIKPSRFRQIFDSEFYEVLAHRNKEGCKIIIVRPGLWDMESYSLMAAIRAFYLVLQEMVDDEETQVHGIHLIVNLDKFTWRQTAHVTPAFARHLFSIMQDTVPLRLRRFDYIFEPSFFDVMFTIFKPFTKKKLAGRIFLNGENFEPIHALIELMHLPEDVAGKLPKLSNKAWMDKAMSSDAKFEEDNMYGFVNMSVGKKDQVSQSGDAGLQGLGGTFKKLDI